MRLPTGANIRDRLGERLRAEERGYAGDSDQKPPVAGYLGTMSAYTGVVAAIAGAARLTHRPLPDGFDLRQAALSAAAIHKLSLLLSKDPATSPLRAPFTRFQENAGPAEVTEQARGTGVRQAVGELISCPSCISVWVGTGLTAGLIFLPRTTRLAIGTLAALAGADLLEYLHDAWPRRPAG
jgi:hypothetical protein